ncbi:oxygenase MpaB family protein [Nocardia sp. alder85J]|uniref:oxygenase MpaB family protein n=1 Tax=Nocardia sp. alder85J TaxID=2862949 RepID=UPI001CD51A28|nr:oxygenase MpaB family protein [Nocardia sp. alder85J]MCX4091336.1 oxygenase MpaB family protein [Nocardia sp. alder85J]
MPDRAPTAPPPGATDVTDAALQRRRRYMSGPAALLGGPANVIMQLGLPPVGRGVVESTVTSGRFDLNPRKRGKTTLTYLAVAMLGTDDDRAAYREAVDTSHRHVRSTADSPVRYNAFDPRLQLWVAACIYRGTADSLALLHGGVDDDIAEELYRESARFGTTLQVRPEMWPADRAAFQQYWDSMLGEIAFDDEVRRYLLDQVVGLGPYHPIQRVLFRDTNRFFTTGYLPQQFRDQLDLDWGPRRQRVFELTMRAIGRTSALLPLRWRLYPFEGYLADMRKPRAQGKSLV